MALWKFVRRRAMANDAELTLELERVERGPAEDGVEPVWLHTSAGTLNTRFHAATGGDAAVVWVSGASGGLLGPAGGLYPRLAAQLVPAGVASLRLDYRRPNQLAACVLDVLLAVAYLGALGRTRVALVGHSFGGAVVITAGAVSQAVIGVAALSSQTAGTAQVHQISPRPLLLIHGTADEILPDRCSRQLYARAGEPRRLLLYDGCGHGLDACREAVARELLDWLQAVACGESQEERGASSDE
jgi:fermentation-respiration switch protein FrsA (DUF1100 family)